MIRFLIVLGFISLTSFAKSSVYEPIAMVNVIKKSSSDIQFWEYVKRENSIEYYKVYLKKYPRGLFVEIAQKRIQELTRIKKQKELYKRDRAHLGIGMGVIGAEIWIRKKRFDYGFAIKSTATLRTIESAAFTNYHFKDTSNGAYGSLSFGYQYITPASRFTPGVGLGIGYRATFFDLIYIDYGIKALVNREYTTTVFNTFTGFDF